MGRPKLTPAERDARKLARQVAKKTQEPNPEDIMAKIAHAQSQVSSNILPPEEGYKTDEPPQGLPLSAVSPEPGENDPDYEARMIDKIEKAIASARAQTMDSLKPPQIKISPLSTSTSEVQIISNREINIEDSEEDRRPEFVKADD